MKRTYKQRPMIWRMNSARRIKKSRIKRKRNRRKPGGNRNQRHVFNRHEPWGCPKWNKNLRKETNIRRRLSAPESDEVLRKVAIIPSNPIAAAAVASVAVAVIIAAAVAAAT